MKKYKQNQEGKQKLEKESVLLELFLNNPNKIFTKEHLAAMFGKSERLIRRELEHIANFYPIRATAGRKGYVLLAVNENSSFDDIYDINNEAYHQVCELQNRIDSLKARMKPLIALMHEIALKSSQKE